MKRTGIFAQLILFALIFSALFSKADSILVRKSLKGPWDMTNKIAGFYNEAANTYDVAIIGSSHAYCGFVPAVIYKETGLKTYILASQLQPAGASYHYLKEILKTQKPKLVIMDVFSAAFDYEMTDGIVHSYADDIPFSLNKLEMIKDVAPASLRAELLFPIIKYHGRWEELNDIDFSFRRSDAHDRLKGYVMLPEAKKISPASGPVQTGSLREDDVKYLKKIAALCRKNGISLLLVKTPTTDHLCYAEKLEQIKALALELGVEFAYCNEEGYMDNLDLSHDYFDERHLNAIGARKFTEAFLPRILKYVSPVDARDKMWNDDYEFYNEKYEWIKKSLGI